MSSEPEIIRIVKPFQGETPKSIGVILGSFDPLHVGHEAMVNTLLSKFEGVLLLLPALHFEKDIRPPLNMSLEQRCEMLGLVYGNNPRVSFGISLEVLFIKLVRRLEEKFAGCSIHLGMGNDTYECLLASSEYYAKLDNPWTAEEEEQLAAVVKSCIVFGRHKPGTIVIRESDVSDESFTLRDSQVVGAFSIGEALTRSGYSDEILDLGASRSGTGRDLLVRSVSNEGTEPGTERVSSTLIRTTIAANKGDEEATRRELKKYLHPRVLKFILDNRLYFEGGGFAAEKAAPLDPRLIGGAVAAAGLLVAAYLYLRKDAE